MIKVLTIGTDRKLFEDRSAVRDRIIEQGKMFGELHIIVFAKKTFGFKNEKISDNVWVYPTNSWSRWFYISDAIRIGRRIIQNSSFNIHNSVLSSQDPFECGLVAKRLAKFGGLNFQVQIHTDFLSSYFKKRSFLNCLRVYIARKVIPSAFRIRVVSKRIADSLNSLFTIHNSSIDVLPVFVDLEKIQNETPVENLHIRFPDANFIIVMASRFSPEKDIGTALRALDLVKAKYSKIKLLIVGEGSEKEKLIELSRKLNLSDNILFLPWQNNLVSFYKSADLFLLTSRYEGFGLTLAEASIAKCPIVTTDVGISRELLTGDFERFVCPVGDFVKISELLGELAGSLELRNKLAESVYSKVSGFILKDRNEYNRKYFELFRSCLPQIK